MMSMLLMLLLLSSAFTRQVHDVPSVGKRVTINSTILGEERELWVWTPSGYSDARPGLPVIYLLEPETHYSHVTAAVQFLSLYLRVPETIVVGVLHGRRGRDYTPPSNPSRDSAGYGGGDRFLQFLTDEVRPQIDQLYRTAPFSILIGHSLSGLITVHAAFTQPDAFSAYIAVSPSLYWADSLTLLSALSVLKNDNTLPRFLYLGLGEAERPDIKSTTKQLATAISEKQPATMKWSFAEFSRENHLTVPMPAYYAALRWLFEGWLAPIGTISTQIAETKSLEPFTKHFDQLSERYGYDVQPAELTFSMIGDGLYQRKMWDETLGLFARRVELYPQSPEAHDELARGYEAAGNLERALVRYEKALELAQSQHHPSLEAIQERLKHAQEASHKN